ncbi:allophanate hydrolase subunit 1 [Amycolatopsis endophytica]|uniref:KipI family sensor histidine kinase inhibitor n=1 Tax=Amycolatopsis endophytica TaxID=860233 RepID=A0A853AWX1_9PSEU|nr:5-oxoprolinase subunit PxpB [Amycolatopsis endophytica]NYI87091.1 KipI family sensor histidine kinase inhibitor [Amycolatopsis endophytica]
MKIRRCGDQALLVDVGEDGDGIGKVLGLYSALADDRPEGVTELVPAARTLLVRFDRTVIGAGELAELLAGTAPVPAKAMRGELVEIPVYYDGADLAEVGKHTGLGADGVVEMHTASEYTVAFGGFAPGFGYLTGLNPKLHLPRRATPRTHVPAGAVAIAGEFTGIYPRSSPGGWQLVGRTEVPLWDPARRPPALLRPGTRIRFREVR